MATVGYCNVCERTVYVQKGDRPLCPVCLTPVGEVQVDESRAERFGRNESLARELNEGIKRGVATDFQSEMVVLCECGRADCSATIPIELAAYEVVRKHSTRFVVCVGHEIGEVETTVAHHDTYVIVEKIGEAAEAAQEPDPI